MRLHRFIVPYDQIGNKITISDEKAIHQITRVFRMNVGDRIIICDNDYTDYVCTIAERGEQQLYLELLETITLPHDQRSITIALAMLKKESFEYALEKMTEVGVTEIIPLLTKRTVKTGFRRDRLEDIVQEATEQSGRGKIPVLREPVKLEELLEISFSGKQYVADFDGQEMRGIFTKNDGNRMVMIGPEGGWDDAERALFDAQKIPKISLGKSVLRAETAAIVAAWCAKNI